MRRSFCFFAALLQERKTAMANTQLISDFKTWKFSHPPNYAQLPIDDNPEYNIPVAVKNAVFSKVPAEPLKGKLHLVCASEDALTDILDLDPKVAETEEFINFVAGAYLPEGGLSVSHRYGGYQFGFWADQLGDGRAHILGEYINSKGESWQPQLKGSGLTPYSRFGDGRAVLRSSLRELLAAEGCARLRVPSSRAAALVVSDDHKVWRDKLYSGRGKEERAAVVMRLAACWYRLGSFEILYKRKEPHTMEQLADFVIKHHFPKISVDGEDRYVEWYMEVAHRNLDMVAAWQGVGFTHGVLNTDNVSVLGVTIDYGPFGFMDQYSEHYVPNSSDDMGRYAFNRQPDVILWNLDKFAEALSLILTGDQMKRIQEFRKTLDQYVKDKILSTYLLKLGLQEAKEGDVALVRDLLQMMQNTTSDFTATFRQLGEVDSDKLYDPVVLESHWSLKIVGKSPQWRQWVDKYTDRLREEDVCEASRRARMCDANPLYVPRNWMLQEAIAYAEKNDFEKVRVLLQVLRNPYQLQEEGERRGYSSPPPSWSYGLKIGVTVVPTQSYIFMFCHP